MSAIHPKAGIKTIGQKSPLIAISGHWVKRILGAETKNLTILSSAQLVTNIRDI
jgi:hypothetical protein